MVDIQEIDRWCATCAKRFREPIAPRASQTRFKLSLVTPQGEYAIYLCAVCNAKLADKVRSVNHPVTDGQRLVTKAS